MEKVIRKIQSFFSEHCLALSGILLLFCLATVWSVFRPCSPSSSEKCSIFRLEPSSHEIEKILMDGRRELSAYDLSWVKELWQNEEGKCYDASLSAFIASRAGVCIPSYSEPVPWEEDARYTMQDSGCGTQIFRTKIKSGDSIGALFRTWLSREEASEAVSAVSSVFRKSRLRIGRTFSVERTTIDGKVSRMMYDIDDESRLIVCRGENGLTAAVNVYHYDTRIVRVSGEVKSSLFDAMADAGESSALAMHLADVFSHQVDFVNDVQEGDSFEVIVEKKYLEGSFRTYGNIVAARFSNDGMVYEAFRFMDDDGRARYYSADGSSLETQFLKAPLNFTRISSGYSLNRRHPVYGRVRPHEGVDYAAPRGTPVKALGNGVVTFVGWKRGYGKSVAIRHSGGVETHYAHLSRYTKNLKKGDKVEQGQIIAFVGSTGVSTGPHLDFRVKKNGKFIDPLKLSGDRAAPVPTEKSDSFQKMVDRARLMLDGEVILASR